MSKLLEQQPRLFGHPTGLYTLFFAEMWERFSYYGMRALLLLYMLKGFLGYGDKDANAVYGAYTALVYMTPFFGGMIADRLLGARTCVVIGGLLMSAGHLLMTIEQDLWFFAALGLLIAGNGFFKPNISTIVGSLYPPGSPQRDGGFTIFYIGINLGAAMAPLLCGYIGETYGWHVGFGLATIGMLIGVAIFVAPTILTQAMILAAAAASAYALLFYKASGTFSLLSNLFVLVALIASGVVAVTALAKGGLPKWAGGTPKPETYFSNLTKVLLGTVVVIPIFVVLVSGCSVLPFVDEQVKLLPESFVKPLQESESPWIKGLATFVEEASRPAGLILILAGLGAAFYLLGQVFKMEKVARERMYVVFILTFFSLLFWSFFEQSGSSVNNFTDRNIDRVNEERLVTQDDVGTSMQLCLVADPSEESLKSLDFLSQEFLGHENGAESVKAVMAKAVRTVNASKEADKQMDDEKLNATIEALNSQPKLTMTALTYLREFAKSKEATASDKQIEWVFVEGNVGKIGLGGSEIPASVFQAVNPIYIMLFGLAFTFAWSMMASMGIEPSTPVKFAFGLIQLGVGFSLLYFGAKMSDSDGMVGYVWLLFMYMLVTTGELCLSPVGLAMVTNLSPARLVSTVMGAWFLATAFSQFLAAIIAQFAAIETGELNIVPVPSETVNVYGNLYAIVAILAVSSGIICLLLSPLMKRWMHVGVEVKEDK